MTSPLPPDLVAARDAEARAILRRNDRGTYTVPTDGLYPYQWNWDSAFAALGFATFDLNRAWVEIETLMAGQWPDGMVPHIQFHQIDPDYFPGPDVWAGTGPVASSGITQPPIAASVMRQLFEADPEAGRPRAAALFDGVLRWHRWFMGWRADAGAIFVTHPWESGRDNTPDWDAPMAAITPRPDLGDYRRTDLGKTDAATRPPKADYDRYLTLVAIGREAGWDQAILRDRTPFRVADPTMTFILLRANRDLAALGRTLNRDVAEIEGWIETLETGAETLWNPLLGSYDARDLATGRFAGCVSNASFLCWWAGIDRAGMRDQLARVCAPVRYGVPSHDPESPAYEPRRYWRGPVWAMLNMAIARGLDAFGHAEGTMLRANSAELIAQNGFAEYFDPRDGSPAGGQDFTWTAAVWLAWASPSADMGEPWAR